MLHALPERCPAARGAATLAHRALVLALTAGACGKATPPAPPAPKPGTAQAAGTPDPQALHEAEVRRQIDAVFPLHGLVTGAQLKIHEKPDPDALVIGWLRIGSRVRVGRDAVKTANCSSGFHALHPHGYVCIGEGVQVGETPPQSTLAGNPPPKDAPLPYAYYLVKEAKVPEYHRLPSTKAQRMVEAFLQRYTELKDKSPEQAEKLLNGELPGEAPGPSIVRRYLERGFFVAGAGMEVSASRQFVRTVRGSYVKLSQLEERKGSTFHGVELDAAHPLPQAWVVRETTPFSAVPRADGTLRYVTDPNEKPLPRLTPIAWAGRTHLGDDLVHKLQDGRYLKYWFVAVAEKIARPKEIRADEAWVHVNIDQQTAVAYRGDTPVYATLVSSGLEGHDTPFGLFEIRAKYVASTMSDIGADADDRYSIEDVPWTQFFSGSIALHGAFWHGGFGLRHSHGCVNLSPFDAHRLFDHTLPELPDGWHGISTDMTGFRASKVYITEK
jgi:hypothetical protein